MRTAIFTFGGTATPGDLLMLSYSAARGGRSTVKVVIGAPAGGDRNEKGWKMVTTIEEVVPAFVAEINGASSEWSPGYGDFKASGKGDRLMVMCSTLMDDVKFSYDVEGARTETCEIDVLG